MSEERKRKNKLLRDFFKREKENAKRRRKYFDSEEEFEKRQRWMSHTKQCDYSCVFFKKGGYCEPDHCAMGEAMFGTLVPLTTESENDEKECPFFLDINELAKNQLKKPIIFKKQEEEKSAE